MKPKWFPMILSVLALPLISQIDNARAHVVPEDELRNKVYLSKTEALQSVFQGVRKIKHRKGHLPEPQIKQVESLIGQPLSAPRVDFYYATGPKGRKLHAFIETAESNSHPPSKAVFIVLVDGTGTVRDMKIMEYKGPQRAEIISRDFLQQFVGKNAETGFSTISSNQGSTPPVRSLAEVVHRVVAQVHVLNGNH